MYKRQTLHCPSSSTLSTAQEGRNAVRSARPKKRNAARSGVESRLNPSGDSDFDVYVMRLWRDHLKETGRSCGRNSSYWKSWFAKLDLSFDSDADGEVLVADIESNCDECEVDDIVSDTDSPLITDDDRRSGPADHDQQLQGGPEKSKHFEVVVEGVFP